MVSAMAGLMRPLLSGPPLPLPLPLPGGRIVASAGARRGAVVVAGGKGGVWRALDFCLGDPAIVILIGRLKDELCRGHQLVLW